MKEEKLKVMTDSAISLFIGSVPTPAIHSNSENKLLDCLKRILGMERMTIF